MSQEKGNHGWTVLSTNGAFHLSLGHRPDLYTQIPQAKIFGLMVPGRPDPGDFRCSPSRHAMETHRRMPVKIRVRSALPGRSTDMEEAPVWECGGKR